MTADALPAVPAGAVEVALPVDGQLCALTAGWLLAQRSEHTRRAYARDIARWLGWLGEHEVDPLAAGRGHVRAWGQALTGEGASQATAARAVSAVSSWYEHLIDAGVVAHNPTARARATTTTRANRVAASSDEVLDSAQARALLAAAEADGVRSAAIMHLALVLGLTPNQIRTARIGDAEEQGERRVLTVTGRGGITRQVGIPAVTWEILARTAAGRQTGPLVATRAGRPMATSEIYRTVARLARAAGIATPTNPRILAATGTALATDPDRDLPANRANQIAQILFNGPPPRGR